MVRHLIYADNITVIVGTKLIEIMERVKKNKQRNEPILKCPKYEGQDYRRY